MSRHIQDLHIKAFRGINNLALENLSDINIFFGYNNCGKTSVLESILLLINPSDFSNVVNVSRIREGIRMNTRFTTTFYDSFIFMFNRAKGDMRIDISGEILSRKAIIQLDGKIENMLLDLDELRKQSILFRERYREEIISNGEEIEGFLGELKYYIEDPQQSLIDSEMKIESIYYHKYISRMSLDRKDPLINSKFISTTDHIVGNTFITITKSRKVTQDIIELLQIFDENIIDIKITQNEDHRFLQTIEHKELGSMPLTTYGDGIKKVIALANGVVGAKNGILLIDEFETSIHKSIMKKVFAWLIKACKEFNVQLFLTTHSQEAVDEFLNCNNSIITDDMARIITLAKKQNKTVARILTGEKALYARDEYDMELRK